MNKKNRIQLFFLFFILLSNFVCWSMDEKNFYDEAYDSDDYSDSGCNTIGLDQNFEPEHLQNFNNFEKSNQFDEEFHHHDPRQQKHMYIEEKITNFLEKSHNLPFENYSTRLEYLFSSLRSDYLFAENAKILKEIIQLCSVDHFCKFYQCFRPHFPEMDTLNSLEKKSSDDLKKKKNFKIVAWLCLKKIITNLAFDKTSNFYAGKLNFLLLKGILKHLTFEYSINNDPIKIMRLLSPQEIICAKLPGKKRFISTYLQLKKNEKKWASQIEETGHEGLRMHGYFDDQITDLFYKKYLFYKLIYALWKIEEVWLSFHKLALCKDILKYTSKFSDFYDHACSCTEKKFHCPFECECEKDEFDKFCFTQKLFCQWKHLCAAGKKYSDFLEKEGPNGRRYYPGNPLEEIEKPEPKKILSVFPGFDIEKYLGIKK